jgi:hypothetical protein
MVPSTTVPDTKNAGSSSREKAPIRQNIYANDKSSKPTAKFVNLYFPISAVSFSLLLMLLELLLVLLLLLLGLLLYSTST